MQPQTIVFIGPQGSGKGTQVANVTEYLQSETNEKVVNIETGKAFRELAQTKSFTNTRVTEILDEGGLIPDFLAEAFVVKFLIRELTPSAHVTMDGFPRTLPQVHFIDELMAFYKRPSLTAVYLNAPESVVKERMAGRGRLDDTPDLIEERLRLYRKNTEPIVSHYREHPTATFIEVDAAKPIQQVYNDIIAHLPR